MDKELANRKEKIQEKIKKRNREIMKKTNSPTKKPQSEVTVKAELSKLIQRDHIESKRTMEQLQRL